MNINNNIIVYIHFFFLSCGLRLEYSPLQYMYAMIFALEEINDSKTLLPGVKLGYHIFDCCGQSPWAPQATLSLAGGDSTTCNIFSYTDDSPQYGEEINKTRGLCCVSKWTQMIMNLYLKWKETCFCLWIICHVTIILFSMLRWAEYPPYHWCGVLCNSWDTLQNPGATLCAVSEYGFETEWTVYCSFIQNIFRELLLLFDVLKQSYFMLNGKKQQPLRMMTKSLNE